MTESIDIIGPPPDDGGGGGDTGGSGSGSGGSYVIPPITGIKGRSRVVTGLPHGKYKIKVKSLNSLGTSSAHGTLTIYTLPPAPSFSVVGSLMESTSVSLQPVGFNQNQRKEAASGYKAIWDGVTLSNALDLPPLQTLETSSFTFADAGIPSYEFFLHTVDADPSSIRIAAVNQSGVGKFVGPTSTASSVKMTEAPSVSGIAGIGSNYVDLSVASGTYRALVINNVKYESAVSPISATGVLGEEYYYDYNTNIDYHAYSSQVKNPSAGVYRVDSLPLNSSVKVDLRTETSRSVNPLRLGYYGDGTSVFHIETQGFKGAPEKVRNTVACLIGKTFASIAWEPPRAIGAPVTQYTIYVYKDDVLVKTVNAGTSRFVKVTGLLPGTLYKAIVTATNSFGEGPLTDTYQVRYQLELDGIYGGNTTYFKTVDSSVTTTTPSVPTTARYSFIDNCANVVVTWNPPQYVNDADGIYKYRVSLEIGTGAKPADVTDVSSFFNTLTLPVAEYYAVGLSKGFHHPKVYVGCYGIKGTTQSAVRSATAEYDCGVWDSYDSYLALPGGAVVTKAECNGNIVTMTTDKAHGLKQGDKGVEPSVVRVSGFSPDGYNTQTGKEKTIIAVTTTAPYTFQYAIDQELEPADTIGTVLYQIGIRGWGPEYDAANKTMSSGSGFTNITPQKRVMLSELTDTSAKVTFMHSFKRGFTGDTNIVKIALASDVETSLSTQTNVVTAVTSYGTVSTGTPFIEVADRTLVRVGMSVSATGISSPCFVASLSGKFPNMVYLTNGFSGVVTGAATFLGNRNSMRIGVGWAPSAYRIPVAASAFTFISDINSREVALTGLMPNTEYVASVYTSGMVTNNSSFRPLTFSFRTLANKSTTVSAPTGISTSYVTASSATVSWNNPSGAVNYVVRISGNPPNGEGCGRRTVAVGAGSTNLDLTGLAAGSKYYVSVHAVDSTGALTDPANVAFSTLTA